MLAHALVFVAHALVLAATTPNAGADVLSRPVLDDVAGGQRLAAMGRRA